MLLQLTRTQMEPELKPPKILANDDALATFSAVRVLFVPAKSVLRHRNYWMNAHLCDLVYLYSLEGMGARDHQDAPLSFEKEVAPCPLTHTMIYQSKY